MIIAAYIIAMLLLVSAGLYMALSRQVVRVAFALFVVLLAVAALFVLAGGELPAVAQVIVYVGGILILLLFGVMLSGKFEGEAPTTGVWYRVPAVLLALVLGGAVWWAFGGGAAFGPLASVQAGSQVEAIGQVNLTRYLLPFEYVSFVLLVALVGAAYLARREQPSPRDTRRKQAEKQQPQAEAATEKRAAA